MEPEISTDVLLAFADRKKKKKKDDDAPATDQKDLAPEPLAKKCVSFEGLPEAPLDDSLLFADLKKKKKKKLEFVMPDEVGAETPPESTVETPADLDSNLFADLKKKKKKSKNDFSDFEKGLKGDDDIVFGESEPVPEVAAVAEESWLGSNRDYTYAELLARIFNILRQNNPDLQGDKKRYTLPPPQILRDGTKKTLFVNILDISKHIRRQPDHLISYLFAEMGTSGSIDGTQRLVIKGRFQQKQIENLLKRYIVEYVSCKTCKGADTALVKENRLFFMSCESCGSKRSVSAIKTGFMAQTGRRPKTT